MCSWYVGMPRLGIFLFFRITTFSPDQLIFCYISFTSGFFNAGLISAKLKECEKIYSSKKFVFTIMV